MARTSRKKNPLNPASTPVEHPFRIYNTAAYCRLSLEDSGNIGADTLRVQEELVFKYIESQPDMRFCGQFSDNGYTGTNFERPSFERLLVEVRAGRIDCIVVKDLSRFGRNYLETGNYLEHVFPFLGVRFVAVNDNFDTLTAERSSEGYIIPLKNIVNELYSRDISRKIVPALNALRERGAFIGSYAPYGYRLCKDDCHRLEPDEETAPIVREIFQLRLEGSSFSELIHLLNKNGTPSPARLRYLRGMAKSESCADAKWGITCVRNLLSSEVYLGHMVQGRKRSRLSEGQKLVHVPEDEWFVVRNTHEPLIDEETFAAVQRINADGRRAYRENLGHHNHLITSPNTLKGLVYCAECKRRMQRGRKPNNRGDEFLYFFTCRSHRDGSAGCTNKYTPEKPLLNMIQDAVLHEIELAENLENAVERYNKNSIASTQEQKKRQEIAAAKQKLTRAKKLYDSLYQSYIDKLMTEQEYQSMKQQYRSEMAQAQALLEQLEDDLLTLSHQVVDNPWIKAFRHFKDCTQLTAEMAQALIEKIEVDADCHVSITLKYRDEFQTLVSTLRSAGMEA